jgi:hypothetical protein
MLCLLLSKVSWAETKVGGTIRTNTTWTAADSPYIVCENVIVSQGVTLNIEPGVVIKFCRDKSLRIDGTLTPHLDAANNWWNTTDEAVIQSEIYDRNIDIGKGKVDYTPYQTSPVPIILPSEGIAIYTDQTSYKEGDSLTLSLGIKNTGKSFKADIFLGFVLLDGSIWFFDESLQDLKPCDPNNPGTYNAARTSLEIPAEYILPRTNFFSVTLPALTPGTYTAFAALAEPGTTQAGNPVLLGPISLTKIPFLSP